MKFQKYFIFYMLIIMLILTFDSCINKDNYKSSNTESYNCFSPLYKIKNFPLTSITTNWAIDLNINHLNSEHSIFCEFNYSTNEFRIVDLYKDKLIKTIEFPEMINKVGSISVYDENNFAFITDTTFYVFKDNKFKRIDYSVFEDDYIPLNYINVIYKPKENILISGVLQYKNRKEEELDYSSFFLNMYDLNTLKSSIIPFPYPQQYHGNKRGIPKVYLSEFDRGLIVSFGLDNNIYKIDLHTNEITPISCKSRISNINDAEYPLHSSKQAKIDAIQKNNLYVGKYGKAFYDESSNKVYRLFQPGLPVKEKNGNYLNSKDRGAHILELNLSDDTIKEIQLANGQYFVPQYWSFNSFNNSLIYPKLEEHVTKNNLCLYNIHSISIYDE